MESRKIKVSIIMNCFNSEKYLNDAIISVINQTYENWELVFWDNCSNDSSPMILKSYKDSRIKYYRSESTDLIYKARNFALNKCTGDYVAFLDCDDIWEKNKLQKQVAMANIGAQVIYGDFELIDENNSKSSKNAYRTSKQKITNLLLIRNFVSIGSVLINASLIKDLKFDPSFQLIGDYDLWLRISTNHSFIKVDGIVEYSRQHSNNVSVTSTSRLWLNERRYLYKKNFLLLINKYFLSLCFFIVVSEIKGLFKFR